MTEEHFDAVVVGSGFGGSVMAHELVQAGLRVCLLERGRAFAPGDFPRGPAGMRDNFWDPSAGRHGLFNVWSFKHMDALVSAGLGGGSLIYANVLIRKDETWFVRDLDHGGYEYWPVTREELDPHYKAAEELIGVSTFPQHLRETTVKVREYAAAVERAGLDHRWLPLAVSFSPPGKANGEPLAGAPPNRFGRTRLTCTLCGECDIGCNTGSKNTLDLTVISAAERAGAEVRTRCEVRSFRPIAGGYRVEYVEHDPANEGAPTATANLPPKVLTCKALVLSAGTFGSTYLLLKNRAALPGLSAMVGQRFSGNGDFLGLLIEATRADGSAWPLDASRGPVITSAVRVKDAVEGGKGRGFYVEDAGYPQFFNWLVEAGLTPTAGGVARLVKFAGRLLRQRLGKIGDSDFGDAIASVIGDCRVTTSSLPMLGMGRDVPDGRMWIDDDDWLELEWKNAASASFFSEIEDVMKKLARAFGAQYQPSPLFALEKRLITVHPLGGCSMARNPVEGVVDSYGEVFGHEGLFVADGAVMPGPVGPNPSLTIAALARRFSERVVERARAA
jgi:cholesterol oxidase